MKNNVFIYSCLGILLTCCGSPSEKDTDTGKSAVTNNQQKISTNPEVDENVVISNPHETSGISSDLEIEKEVQLISNNNDPEIEEGTDKKGQSKGDPVVAVSQTTETGKTSAVVKETSRPEAKPSEEKPIQANSVYISVVPDLMKFDKEVFTVIAGQKVIIELDNPDGMQHNLVIGKPGTLKIVGAAADALARDPKGAQLQYVPQIPEVLHATKLLDPNEIVTLTFTAPTEPGDYPFVCTFPGHWRMMNGIMKVTQ